MNFQMRHFLQASKSSCGAACCAMLFSRFFPTSKFADPKYLVTMFKGGANLNDMRYILSIPMGEEIKLLRETYMRQSIKIPTDKLLLIKVDYPKRKAGHWIILDRTLVYDPADKNVAGFTEWMVTHKDAWIVSYTEVCDPGLNLCA